jgi:hypothetical protein
MRRRSGLPEWINAAVKRLAGADKCGGEVACWDGHNRFIKIDDFFCFLIQMGVFKGFS